jgi:hypothetical protein
MAVVVLLAVTGNYLLYCQPVDAVSPSLSAWWTVMCVVSVCNIWLWRHSARALSDRRETMDRAEYQYQRWQLLLSAAYVFGCAFRALLPRADVQRIGIFDTWASSVLVGRSVATVAELCFAVQWAMFLRQTARRADCRRAASIAYLIVPLIVVAEVCSWYAVLTTAYIGNALEESIWAMCGLMLVISLLVVRRDAPAVTRPTIGAAVVLGCGYVAYMCTVDVPMYVSRWMTDEINGRVYLSLTHGLWDVGSRWIVTHTWEEWHPEVAWMSLYFSVGVWCSLALVHLPWRDERLDEPARLCNVLSGERR